MCFSTDSATYTLRSCVVVPSVGTPQEAVLRACDLHGTERPSWESLCDMRSESDCIAAVMEHCALDEREAAMLLQIAVA
jgi:hypothetical protein